MGLVGLMQLQKKQNKTVNYKKIFVYYTMKTQDK